MRASSRRTTRVSLLSAVFRDLRLEFLDPGFQGADVIAHLLDLFLREARLDVLRAVSVHDLDLEDEDAFVLRAVVGIHDTRHQVRIVFDELRAPPDLEPLTVRVVHEKETRAIVFGEVAHRDVLAVAGVLDEGERLAVQDLQESPRSSAMLDVGAAVRARRGDVDGLALADERRARFRDLLVPAGAGTHLLVDPARTEALLLGLDRRREREVARVFAHEEDRSVLSWLTATQSDWPAVSRPVTFPGGSHRNRHA